MQRGPGLIVVLAGYANSASPRPRRPAWPGWAASGLPWWGVPSEERHREADGVSRPYGHCGGMECLGPLDISRKSAREGARPFTPNLPRSERHVEVFHPGMQWLLGFIDGTQ